MLYIRDITVVRSSASWVLADGSTDMRRTYIFVSKCRTLRTFANKKRRIRAAQRTER